MEDDGKKIEVSKKNDKKGSKAKVWLVVLLILLLIAAGAGAYWWKDNQCRQKVSELESKVAELEAAEEKPAEEEADTGEETSLEEIITAAVNSSDYATLEEHMSDPVTVILAASEAHGPQTPAEALISLEYLDNATGPWDFDLPPATVASYRGMAYGSYFPVGALVGKSTDNYVVSFTFNSSGQISGIFMSPSEDLLL